MRTTITQGYHMVYLCGFTTTLYTLLVCLEVSSTYHSPLGIVATPGRAGAVVWLSLLLLLAGMSGTVPTVCSTA